MNDQKKAWIGSLIVHVSLFCLLGASGLFTYLHEKDRTPSVTDVMVYDENALTTRGPVASGGESSDTAANAVVMNKKSVEAGPAISQSYTKEHREKESESKHLGDSKETHDTQGDGHSGQGNEGLGHGEGAPGNGADKTGAKSLRPAKKAQLLTQGTFTVPPSARNSAGTISLSIVINADGSVVETSVISNSSGNDDVEKAAIAFAYSLHYVPGENEYGQAITQSKTITLSY